MKTKTIDEELAEVLMGNIKLDGQVTRNDGTKIFWFTDKKGQQHKYATPRPNNDPIDLVKQRWKNVTGLDPEANNSNPQSTAS